MAFPEKIIDREKFIMDKVLTGTFEASWSEIEYTTQGRIAKFLVMEDALKIDGVRVNVSATLQQKLADLFDASLMTAQLADLVYISASRKIDPAPMPISTSVASMTKHSASVDARLNKLTNNKSGLVADSGKHWILDKKLEQLPGRACNYGWHFVGSSYQGINGFPVASKLNSFNTKPVKVIQPNATAHDALHSDYSQICQLVSQTCWVDGVEKRFSELLVDPILSALVSHQGPLKITRQPGVPEQKGQIVIFPTIITSVVPVV
jgi:hypothetical protein